MRKISQLFIIGLIALTGCQEEIDLDLPATEPELVIEGYITQRDYYFPEADLDCFGVTTISLDTLKFATEFVDAFINIDSIEAETDIFPFNKVVLSTTGDYFANASPPEVTGASVILFENGNAVETLMEDPLTPGTYRISYLPIVGSSYHITVDALGNFYETKPELYESVPPLLSLASSYGSNFIQDSCAYYMSMNTFEKPGLGDHYRWFFYVNNKYVSNPGNISLTNDENFDGFCLLDFDVYGNELELGDSLVVFQMHTTEGYYNFLNTVQSQTAFVGGPFDAPPAPIIGNVTNVTTGKAAFGYFAAGGISANATTTPETIPDPDNPNSCLD
jgi:hypothetical protein